AAAEQQADRLGEDRLAGARLAGDRAESRREGEIRLTDEDEVLDPKAPEHWIGCYAERPRPATGSNGRRRAPSLSTRARPWVGGGLGRYPPTAHAGVPIACRSCADVRAGGAGAPIAAEESALGQGRQQAARGGQADDH